MSKHRTTCVRAKLSTSFDQRPRQGEAKADAFKQMCSNTFTVIKYTLQKGYARSSGPFCDGEKVAFVETVL
jgi:hypothetical protein